MSATPLLPWDVVRAVLEQLFHDAHCPAPAQPGRSQAPQQQPATRRTYSNYKTSAPPAKACPDYRGLLHAAALSRAFCAEAQALLFRDIDLTRRSATRYPHLLYWSTSSRLCGLVQTLRLPCVELDGRVTGLLNRCSNVRRLVLDVKGVEKRECLLECIQGALMRMQRLEELHLVGATSIGTVAMAYSLPYRLRKLSIEGLRGYSGALWENPYERLDAEAIEFDRCRLDGYDVRYFCELLEKEGVPPPTSLRAKGTVFDLDRIPLATAHSLTHLDLEEAQPLLNLDALSRFPSLGHLAISTRHNFVTLTGDLPQIKRVTFIKVNEHMARLWPDWLEAGLLSKLELITFAEDAFVEDAEDRSGQLGIYSVERLDQAIRRRGIACKPGRPGDLYRPSWVLL